MIDTMTPTNAMSTTILLVTIKFLLIVKLVQNQRLINSEFKLKPYFQSLFELL